MQSHIGYNCVVAQYRRLINSSTSVSILFEKAFLDSSFNGPVISKGNLQLVLIRARPNNEKRCDTNQISKWGFIAKTLRNRCYGSVTCRDVVILASKPNGRSVASLEIWFTTHFSPKLSSFRARYYVSSFCTSLYLLVLPSIAKANTK